LWSSKKLDKSGGTITGPVVSRSTITASHFVGSGTGLTDVALLASTQTFTGQNTFASDTTFSGGVVGNTTFETTTATTTFSGWIDIGYEVVYASAASITALSVSCSAGKRVISCNCYAANDLLGCYSNPIASIKPSSCRADQTPAGVMDVNAICARVK